ncbi:MAG: AGE family epimerase/isomerase [Pseudomonadota bacterium]
MSVYPVIMCGGSGTRLWPESRPERPKQFLALVGARSMFQDTVLRVAPLAERGEVLIVAGAGHASLITTQLAQIGVAATVLLEPEPRDSAPAMAAACAWIAARDPDGVAVVVAADHHIPDGEAFGHAARTAVDAARAGHIVTLGIAPTSPSTAYGYISPGERLGPVCRVEAFVEKPDAQTAQRYIEAGYLWNSGNFVVAAQVLMAELETFAPEIASAAREAISHAVSSDGVAPVVRLSEAFRQARKISIDYAVMERTRRTAVLPVDFAWSDLGAWEAVMAASPADDAGNVVLGDALLIDARNCLVRAGEGRQVAVLGLSELAVIADGPRILVSRLADSQKVKAAAEHFAGRKGASIEGAAFSTLAEAADWFDVWLRASALPLWWTLGADHLAGGYVEGLTPQGRPLGAPRRSRVQTRQAYVYAVAGQLGWEGPWREAAWHGLKGFLERYRRPDGFFRALVSAAGEPLEETAALYDQAFALLAMAALHRTDPGHTDLEGQAEQLLGALQGLRHSAGGFREIEPHVFQANAHMHLLEAAMAWIEAGGGPQWRHLASEIAGLALDRFIDPCGGVLREFFDVDWRPAHGDDGRLVEPGHQFEWAWLLTRWARLTSSDSAAQAAERLFQAGLRGVDPVRGVAINAMNDDFSVRDASARLWPQTEWLKASLILGREAEALRAANGLRAYLSTPAQGAWRDKMQPDGGFVEEAAPASSFYHIMAACQELASYRGIVAEKGD